MNKVIRYETEGMARIREHCLNAGFSDKEVDNFKAVLSQLEAHGFKLKGPANF